MEQNSSQPGNLPEFEFRTPRGYRLLWEQKLVGFNAAESPLDPWYYLSSNDVFDVTQIWPKRLRIDILIAFARRYDSDDIACFEVENGRVKQVLLIHGWTPEGYEVLATYQNFWDWVKSVIDDIAFLADNDIS